MCLVFSLFTTLPLSSFPSPFTVFIVLSSVCTGVGWKCLDFDKLELRVLYATLTRIETGYEISRNQITQLDA